jgi:hypothetical protein
VPTLPAGLAKTLAPFALTLGSAARLPDAPAVAATIDAACDPVTAHLRWAKLRVVSQTATSTSPWGPPVGYPPMRARTCAFGKVGRVVCRFARRPLVSPVS